MLKKIEGRLKRVWYIAIELLYPRRCPICDGYPPFGQKVCPSCIKKIKYVHAPRCFKCGKELKKETDEYCFDCRRRRHIFEQGRALFEYQSVSDSIYRYKYVHRKEYAAFYGEQIVLYLGDLMRDWHADILVPVPIHPARKRKRGFNQAECLADEIGNRLQIPVEKQLIKRIRNTMPQKELDDSERQNNLKKAFKIGINSVKLKSAIIIDDIYTTGSTIDACASILRDAGVKKIYFITLAIGKGL